MMRNFKHTVSCSRAATQSTTDAFGNTTGEDRPEVTFVAAFVPPTTQLGSQIVDGPLRETTITKPTLMIDRRQQNAAALLPGALRSGDYITINGDQEWQVDGDPADFTHPLTGWQPPLVVELRKWVG